MDNKDQSQAKNEIEALNNQYPASAPPKKDVSTTPSDKVQSQFPQPVSGTPLTSVTFTAMLITRAFLPSKFTKSSMPSLDGKRNYRGPKGDSLYKYSILSAENASVHANVPKGQNCFIIGPSKQKEHETSDPYKLNTITCGLSLQSPSSNADKSIIPDSTSCVAFPPTNPTTTTQNILLNTDPRAPGLHFSSSSIT